MSKKPNHRMYKLYFLIDIINSAALIVPLVLLIAIIIQIKDAIYWGYIDFDTLVMILIFGAVITFTCIMFIPRLGNHYSRIDKVRKVNPELVHQYEDEFVASEDLGNEIFLSQNFLFISGAKKFVVATPNEVTKIYLFIRHTKHGNWLKYEISGSDFKETVQICNLINDEDIEYANRSIDKLTSWTSAPIEFSSSARKRLNRY